MQKSRSLDKLNDINPGQGQSYTFSIHHSVVRKVRVSVITVQNTQLNKYTCWEEYLDRNFMKF